MGQPRKTGQFPEKLRRPSQKKNKKCGVVQLAFKNIWRQHDSFPCLVFLAYSFLLVPGLDHYLPKKSTRDGETEAVHSGRPFSWTNASGAALGLCFFEGTLFGSVHRENKGKVLSVSPICAAACATFFLGGGRPASALHPAESGARPNSGAMLTLV